MLPTQRAQHEVGMSTAPQIHWLTREYVSLHQNMLNAMETALETYETQNEDFGDSIKYHAMTAMRSLIVKNDANLQAARCLKLEPLLRRLRDQSENEEGERELAASLLHMILV